MSPNHAVIYTRQWSWALWSGEVPRGQVRRSGNPAKLWMAKPGRSLSLSFGSPHAMPWFSPPFERTTEGAA